ncbi:ABC transporter ATP-binding protein [Hyphobacterium marinum]|uniref:ABC transporter ATP-binding protein n=1 Tax=Hyphobacterium marinum TaxID=3116574 RepID=A0ABU7M1J0_9PROT|nr:ABC transporter ATP-binding protein [Hyphobacterium sp. Y6023]MEE2567541.1 ABC transporter ATP-binding protein [Hyphobacterium sp. Y6023]
MSKPTPVLALTGIERTYKTEAGALNVLKDAGMELFPGEVVGLVGPSGSGKSSLLHIAGLLEKPDAGQVFLDGRDVTALSDRERTGLRRSMIGFVYQFHHLLPEFDARENIVLPQLINGQSRRIALAEADRLLASMGLTQRAQHQPAQLSGGEQQRVAIARAFANKPKIILADEPTGNLDPATSDSVFQAFSNAARDEGVAALVATHNLALAERMDRVLTFQDHHVTAWQPAA